MERRTIRGLGMLKKGSGGKKRKERSRGFTFAKECVTLREVENAKPKERGGRRIERLYTDEVE